MENREIECRFLEIEGQSKEEVRAAAELLGFDWNEAVFKNAVKVLEENYNIPLKNLEVFTFDSIQ